MEHKALYEKRFEQFIKLGAFLDWATTEIKDIMKKRELRFEKFRESRGANMNKREYKAWIEVQFGKVVNIPTDLVVEFLDLSGAYKLKPAFITKNEDVREILLRKTFVDMTGTFDVNDGFNESTYMDMLETYSTENGYDGINDEQLYFDLMNKMNKIQELLVSVVHTTRDDVRVFLTEVDKIEKSWNE